MSVHIVRLPDVGEGVAEAELVAWHVAVGDTVTSDTVVAEVLTDKSTVEIYAPVAGRIAELHGEAGDVLAVGSDFIAIETDESVALPAAASAAATEPIQTTVPTGVVVAESTEEPATTSAEEAAPPAQRALAAPAVRERARALGVELGDISGSGSEGQITHDDLDRYLQHAAPAARGNGRPPVAATTQVPLIGLRRKIAARMTTASSRIPHITYVDEVDMTRLLRLRQSLATAYPHQPRLSVLPFVMRALVLAIADQPQLNATFDDEAEVLTTYRAVHIGIATQTKDGLIVPVVRDAQEMDLWSSATELARITNSARNGTAARTELSGSTITITSLGALGGLVTTPIINHPEVAIVGINKLQTRPMWDGNSFLPRSMMNLSSSFDHRIIDGWVAATFVQRIKTLLEEPSLLFTPQPPTPGPPSPAVNE